MKKILAVMFILVFFLTLLSSCANTQAGVSAEPGVGYGVSGGNAVGRLIGAGTRADIGNTFDEDDIGPAYYGPYYSY